MIPWHARVTLDCTKLLRPSVGRRFCRIGRPQRERGAGRGGPGRAGPCRAEAGGRARTHARTHARKAWTNGRKHGRPHAWTNGRTDARTHGRTDARTHGRTDAALMVSSTLHNPWVNYCGRPCSMTSIASEERIGAWKLSVVFGGA